MGLGRGGNTLSPEAVSAQPLPTVPQVDPARYAGTWHEIAATARDRWTD